MTTAVKKSVDDETIEATRRLDSQQVAESFGLERAARKYFACPSCRSSDAFRIKPEIDSGGFCFSCGACASDNIALAELLLDVDFRESVGAISDRFGLPSGPTDSSGPTAPAAPTDPPPDDDQPPPPDPSPTDTAPPPTDPPTADDYAQRERSAIQWESKLGAAHSLLAEVWDALELDGDGAAYLEHRGIPADGTAETCVRSVSRDQWRFILNQFDGDDLRAAGISSYFLRPDWTSGDDREPFTEALVFGYRSDLEGVSTLRFREAAPGAPVMSLCGSSLDIPNDSGLALEPHTPSGPYLSAQAVELADRHNKPVVIVEGEIDALSCVLAGYPAVGAPGAAYFWAEWVAPFAGRDVVIIGDGDRAGETLIDSVLDAAETCGAIDSEAWLSRHVKDFQFAGGDLDANDLLERGLLSNALAEAERLLAQKKTANRAPG